MRLALPETLKIVGLSVAAAVVYGILHDQVTAHLCVEYFSVAHPRVIASDSPFLLALVWGVIATWWVGLPLGIGLAAAARIGPSRKLALAELRPSILGLMLVSAAAALVAGCAGAMLVANGLTGVPGGWAEVIPPAKWVAFSADAWAHEASYGVGLLGGVFIVVRTVWVRLRSEHGGGA